MIYVLDNIKDSNDLEPVPDLVPDVVHDREPKKVKKYWKI